MNSVDPQDCCVIGDGFALRACEIGKTGCQLHLKGVIGRDVVRRAGDVARQKDDDVALRCLERHKKAPPPTPRKANSHVPTPLQTPDVRDVSSPLDIPKGSVSRRESG